MNDATLTQILKSSKRIAVIGLSPVSSRPSFGVTRYMIEHGYEIFGVRPAAPKEILGRPCVESLKELNEDVDIINVFRNPESLPELMNEVEAWMKTRAQKPRVIWFQEGVVNPSAEDHARRLGLTVVSDRCILKDHQRLQTG